MSSEESIVEVPQDQQVTNTVEATPEVTTEAATSTTTEAGAEPAAESASTVFTSESVSSSDNVVDVTEGDSAAAKRKADESESVASEESSSTPSSETRESLITSVTVPAGFDESSARRVDFPAAKYPNVNLLEFVAGYRDYFAENYPGSIVYVATPAEGTPYVLVSGQEVDKVGDYLEYYFNDENYFNGALDYSRNIVAGYPSSSAPSKKRSRFNTVDDDAVVQLPTSAAQSSGYGAEASIPSTSAAMQAASQMSSGPQTDVIYIPEDKVGLIIGRKGDTINMLQTICGAKVTITRESNVDPRGRPVTIAGNPSQIAHCHQEINRLIDNAQSNPEPGVNDSMPHEKLHVSSDVVGVLIGRSGETVRILQMKTGCTVRIQKDNDVQDPSSGREITIYGNPEQRENAKAEIDRLVKAAEGQSAVDTAELLIGKPKGRSVQMSVANHMVGLIIGRGGENIKSIQQQTGAKIQIDKDSGAPMRNMTISAASESQVAHARQLVEAIMQRPQQGGRGGFGGQGAYGGGAPAYNMPSHGAPYGQAQPYGAPYGQAPMGGAPYGAYDPYAAGAYPPAHQSYGAPAGNMAPYGQHGAPGGYQGAGQQAPAVGGAPAAAYSQAGQTSAPAPGQDKAAMRAYYVDHYMKQGYPRDQAEAYADYYLKNPQ